MPVRLNEPPVDRLKRLSLRKKLASFVAETRSLPAAPSSVTALSLVVAAGNRVEDRSLVRSLRAAPVTAYFPRAGASGPALQSSAGAVYQKFTQVAETEHDRCIESARLT